MISNRNWSVFEKRCIKKGAIERSEPNFLAADLWHFPPCYLNAEKHGLGRWKRHTVLWSKIEIHLFVDADQYGSQKKRSITVLQQFQHKCCWRKDYCYYTHKTNAPCLLSLPVLPSRYPCEQYRQNNRWDRILYVSQWRKRFLRHSN